jgi:hypothetical protein
VEIVDTEIDVAEDVVRIVIVAKQVVENGRLKNYKLLYALKIRR